MEVFHKCVPSHTRKPKSYNVIKILNLIGKKLNICCKDQNKMK